MKTQLRIELEKMEDDCKYLTELLCIKEDRFLVREVIDFTSGTVDYRQLSDLKCYYIDEYSNKNEISVHEYYRKLESRLLHLQNTYRDTIGIRVR